MPSTQAARTGQLAATCAGFLLAAAAGAAEVAPAPAFSAPQLLALPAQSWITNGGNLFNQRYSPLAARSTATTSRT